MIELIALCGLVLTVWIASIQILGNLGITIGLIFTILCAGLLILNIAENRKEEERRTGSQKKVSAVKTAGFHKSDTNAW